MTSDLQARIDAHFGIDPMLSAQVAAAGRLAGKAALAHHAWRQAKLACGKDACQPNSALYHERVGARKAKAVAWEAAFDAFLGELAVALRMAGQALPDWQGLTQSLCGELGHSRGNLAGLSIRAAWAGRGGHLGWLESHGQGRLTWAQAQAVEGLSRAFMARCYAIGGEGYALPGNWRAVVALACLAAYAMAFATPKTQADKVFTRLIGEGRRRYGRPGKLLSDARDAD